MKMDMNRTTTYMTTKNRIGCRAPKELDLDLIRKSLGFSKKLGSGYWFQWVKIID
jgi:hypothetical protein